MAKFRHWQETVTGELAKRVSIPAFSVGSSIANVLRMTITSVSQLNATNPATDSTLDVSRTATPIITGAPPVDLHPETSQLVAYMQQLYQMQQSDPAQFQTVTAQIGQQLSAAAQQATQNGEPVVSAGLTNLAGQFTQASQGGAVPNPAQPAQPPVSNGGPSSGGSAGGPDSNNLLLKAAVVHGYRTVYGDPVAATLTSILGSVLPSDSSS